MNRRVFLALIAIFLILSLVGCVSITPSDGDTSGTTAPMKATEPPIEESTTVPAPPPTDGVNLDLQSFALGVYEVYALTATVLPEPQPVVWGSEDESIATVDQNGTVKGVSPGETRIYAMLENTPESRSYCRVEVTAGTAATGNKSMLLNGSTYDISSRYTSNFGSDEVSYISLSYYRATKDYNADLGVFYAYSTLTDTPDLSLPGAIYNTERMTGIVSLTIEYQSAGDVKISFGDGRDYNEIYRLPAQSAYGTQTLNLRTTANYFMVEATTSALYINSIKIEYGAACTETASTAKTSDLRILPTVYQGELISGVSSVTVPDEITIENGSYTVKSYKTYTYYSYEYIVANKTQLNLSEIAITDPVDIANYYIAFEEIPPNFGYSGKSKKPDASIDFCATVDQVEALFGENAREISKYTRDSGYAVGLPYNPHGSGSNPYYYEFDVDLDGTYTTSNRGVGRVVMWVDGWSCYETDAPVATVTYDHYETFAQYLGYSEFGTPFDTNGSIGRTACALGITVTLTPAGSVEYTLLVLYFEELKIKL